LAGMDNLALTLRIFCIRHCFVLALLAFALFAGKLALFAWLLLRTALAATLMSTSVRLLYHLFLLLLLLNKTKTSFENSKCSGCKAIASTITKQRMVVKCKSERHTEACPIE